VFELSLFMLGSLLLNVPELLFSALRAPVCLEKYAVVEWVFSRRGRREVRKG
jgi:hypothetical protein